MRLAMPRQTHPSTVASMNPPGTQILKETGGWWGNKDPDVARLFQWTKGMLTNKDKMVKITKKMHSLKPYSGNTFRSSLNWPNKLTQHAKMPGHSSSSSAVQRLLHTWWSSTGLCKKISVGLKEDLHWTSANHICGNIYNAYDLSILVPLALLLLGYSSRHTNTPAALFTGQGWYFGSVIIETYHTHLTEYVRGSFKTMTKVHLSWAAFLIKTIKKNYKLFTVVLVYRCKVFLYKVRKMGISNTSTFQKSTF